MKISECIQQLQDLYEKEGDIEVVMVINNHPEGYEPHIHKSSFYDRCDISIF